MRQALEHQGMPAFTPNNIVTPEELYEELQRIRERGYSFDNEETLQGLRCVSAPVRDADEQIIAALSVSSPAFRYEDHEEEYTRAVVEGARRVSESVGYRAKDNSGHVSHRMEGSRG